MKRHSPNVLFTVFFCGCLVMTCAPALAAAADDDAVKSEMSRLEGTWTMVSGERGGMKMDNMMVKSGKRVVKDGETTVTFGEMLWMKAKFSVNPTKSPKTIDYTLLSGEDKGKQQLGIYELDGDTLKICYASPGADRPTLFTTSAGDGHTASVWKKSKQPG
jgi:uncharacterized protein (TIGR03067 family)